MRRMNRSEPSLHINEIDVYDKYEFVRQVGKGSYGEVWLVLPVRSASSAKSNSKQYVLKRLYLEHESQDTNQSDIEAAEREAKLLSTLKHPNIVAYIESFRSNDSFLNIVMAYCEGGDLYTKLKERKTNQQPLEENQLIEWFIQICMALQHMHEKSILHRDLKTQNIFLTKNEIIKVGDLGIARVLDSGGDLATTIIGTPYYMSPEIFSHVPYGQKSDIWALGCCVYEMTTLEHAFNARDLSSLAIKIIRGQIPKTSQKYSEQLSTIIKSMLKTNPDDRPTAKEILQSTYIKQHIRRLLDKTKVKCQNGINSNVQISAVSSTPRTPSFSLPSRPSSSSNDVKISYSSEKSPLPKKSQENRLKDNNTPILPSYNGLPPSHGNRPSNQIVPSSGSSSSSTDASQATPQSENASVSSARIRRRLRINQNVHPSIEEQPENIKFLLQVRENDTLQRHRRAQKNANHSKQQQSMSSDDEHQVYQPRPAVVVAVPSKAVPNGRSTELPAELNYHKASCDDDVYSSERESNTSYEQEQRSSSKVTKSYDSHGNHIPYSKARERRRHNRLRSSLESANQRSSNHDSELFVEPSIESNENDIETKREGQKDINDLVFMLTATLKLAPSNPLSNVESLDFHSSEITNMSDDSDGTLVATGSHHTSFTEQTSESMSLTDGTLEMNQYSTLRNARRYETIKQTCLADISPEKLRSIIRKMHGLSETQMKQLMIDALGKDLFDKHASNIYVLEFYESSSQKHIV